MSSEYEAFRPTTVLSNFPKQILSLEYIGERLFVGLGDGSLVVLAKPEQAQDNNSSWQVVQAHKTFGRKYVSQLQAIKQSTLLLSLSEDGVNLYTIPQLKLTCQANSTRSASRFAWSEDKSMLCVAVKRKVMQFHYDGRDFVELKAYSAPDTPQALHWIGDAICIGCKKEYVLMQSSSGVTSKIAVTDRATQACITEVSRTELLVNLHTSSLFLGGNAKLSERPSITWSDHPVAVAYSRPYAVAMLPVQVRSAHRLSDHGLTQKLPIAGTSVLTACQSSGNIFVAATGSDGIHQLAPVPFDQQAKALADVDQFAEALTMIAYLHDSQTEPNRLLKDGIHIRYGHHLFGRGEFDEGLAQMGMTSSSNPVTLLHLFPSLASPALLQPVSHLVPGVKLPKVAEPTGEAYSDAVSILLPYLLSHRSRLAAFTAATDTAHQAAASQASTTAGSHPATAQHQSASRSGEPPEAAAPRGSYSEAMEEAGEPGSPMRSKPQEFLAGLQPEQRHRLAVLVDTAILKVMLAMVDTGALLCFLHRSNDVDLREGEVVLRARGRYSELVALYQQRGQHEAALDLLHTLTLSPQDLNIRPQGAAADLRDLTGVWAAVRYLVKVGGNQTGLVKKHARWILTVDPEAGLEMFTGMQPPLSPDSLLPILASHAPSLCATYLEAAIAQGSVSAQEYDTYLAEMYLQTVLEEADTEQQQHQQPIAPSTEGSSQNALQQSGSDAATPDVPKAALAQQDAYAKLKRLVMMSQFIDAERLLKVIPHARLLEIQALLHKHLGDHKEALRIYLELMHDYKLAEEYCDGIYQESNSTSLHGMHQLPASLQSRLKGVVSQGWGGPGGPGSDIYLLLIKALLQQDEAAFSEAAGQREDGQKASQISARWQEVAQLLERKHDRIDSVQALPMLPLQMPLRLLLPFLEGAVRLLVEQVRNAAVVRSLRRSDNLQVREDLTKSKQRSVLVTSERACLLCHRRIANTVFVAYPDGPLAHYSCHKKQTGSQQLDPSLSSPL
ncbi:MAG: vam6 Vps39 isoform X1 [Trebouxia sp. A1-2]|nr:MAG: vam6 Vps39 isoform X1 [Trebouxia sp. A1-2]